MKANKAMSIEALIERELERIHERLLILFLLRARAEEAEKRGMTILFTEDEINDLIH
jgi:hypothetical protein